MGPLADLIAILAMGALIIGVPAVAIWARRNKATDHADPDDASGISEAEWSNAIR